MTLTATAARHSMDSPEWYTPSPFVEAARTLMGGIELDPASHEEANARIRATRYFDEAANGLTRSWHGRVFINPPGGKDVRGESLVPQFWTRLVEEYLLGHTTESVWIGYSLEQLQTLQGAAAPRSPLHFPMCIPRKRIAFIENEAKKAARIAKLLAEGKSPNQKSQPSHANYITYLGPHVETFQTVFQQFGAVRG